MKEIEVEINGKPYAIRYAISKQNKEYAIDVFIDDVELQQATGSQFQFLLSPAGKKDDKQCWQPGGYDILSIEAEERTLIWNKIFRKEQPTLQFP